MSALDIHTNGNETTTSNQTIVTKRTKPIRIVSWNTGMRGLTKTVRHEGGINVLLSNLDADILCIQETKLRSRDELMPSIAFAEGYKSFFSVNRKLRAYSGTATYVRDDIPILRAEEGISGILTEQEIPHDQWIKPHITSEIDVDNVVNWDTISRNDYGIDPVATHVQFDPIMYDSITFQQLESEGRCVVTDHGAFVLFNVYFPVSHGSQQRIHFKYKFNAIIQARVQALIDCGRSVIITGDFNVAHTRQDHCDPEGSERESGVIFEFSRHRKWLHNFIQGTNYDNQLIDCFRHFNPNRKGVFTCWNKMTSARKTNYGTRIDYVLLSQTLKQALLSADVMTEFYGSDHCPVWAQIDVHALKMYKFQNPPKELSLCTQVWPTLQARQRNLHTFLHPGLASETSQSVSISHENEIQYQKHSTYSPNGDIAENDEALSLSIVVDETATLKQTSTPKHTPISQHCLRSKKRMRKTTLFDFIPSQKSVAHATSHSNDVVILLDSDTDDTENDAVTESHPENNSASTSFADVKSLQFTTTSRNSTSGAITPDSNASTKWSALLRGPIPPPVCEKHKEPTVERTVLKTGINSGRQFYVCARPNGLSTDTAARCNFFMWKSQWKKIYTSQEQQTPS